MRVFLLILFLLPAISFAQKKDYKNYDKAVAYFHEGKVEKAKKLTEKILAKNSEWTKPNLLMASIFADLGDIVESANYLLNVYDEKKSGVITEVFSDMDSYDHMKLENGMKILLSINLQKIL